MQASNFPSVLLFDEHGHLVVTVQRPLSDSQWRQISRSVLTQARRRRSGVVLDLHGLDVLDSFSFSVLQTLCKTLHFHGRAVVISGIPLPVSLILTIRGLDISEAPVVPGLPEAFNLLEHRSLYPPFPPRSRN